VKSASPLVSVALLCLSSLAFAETAFFEYNGKFYPLEIASNPCAEALVKRLPIMMSFEDFGKSERIAYLKYPLPFSKEKISYTPKKGDIAYWPPRRNLTVFLDAPEYKADVVPIGHLSDEALEMVRTSKSWVMNLVRESK